MLNELMDLLLRPTQDGDIRAVTAIYRQAVLFGTASYEIEPPGEQELDRRWRALLASGHPHIVAVSDGTVLGYAYAGPFRTRPAYRFTVEDSVYVAPEAQGTGVGRALLSSLVATCERCGFRQMIAVIGDGAGHPASVGLHLSAGFRQIGLIEGSGWKHGRWLDTVLMQRALGSGATSSPDELSP